MADIKLRKEKRKIMNKRQWEIMSLTVVVNHNDYCYYSIVGWAQ
jgi:hypothetical protein